MPDTVLIFDNHASIVRHAFSLRYFRMAISATPDAGFRNSAAFCFKRMWVTGSSVNENRSRFGFFDLLICALYTPVARDARFIFREEKRLTRKNQPLGVTKCRRRPRLGRGFAGQDQCSMNAGPEAEISIPQNSSCFYFCFVRISLSTSVLHVCFSPTRNAFQQSRKPFAQSVTARVRLDAA